MLKNYHLNQIDAIAKSLLAALKHKIILLKGDLGAGKTTLVKEIVKQLGSMIVPCNNCITYLYISS